MSTIKGKLIVKNKILSFGSNGFTKREFVVETDSQYPQMIMIELIKDKCSLIENIDIGATIEVHYNLNGRMWTSPKGEVKYFNKIQGWKIEKVELGQSPEQSQVDKNLEEDDLPF